MRSTDSAHGVLTREAMQREIEKLHAAGKKVVFTNGSFDLLHTGHLTYLTFARAQGDCLVVGVNSDASVRRYKEPGRPILPQAERAALLAGLRCVDYVVIFDEDEPRDLIASLRPDVLVKGEDWAHYVSGREEVESRGGKVILAPLVPGRSTSAIIKKILELPPKS